MPRDSRACYRKGCAVNECEKCKSFYLELERLHRLAPTGTYTVSLPHEQEIQRLSGEKYTWQARAELAEEAANGLREALRAAEKRELEALAELNEREADAQALRDSRDKWAETARKLGEQLEWTNDMACENTPTPGWCECPGCLLARDRARRGVAGPEDER